MPRHRRAFARSSILLALSCAAFLAAPLEAQRAAGRPRQGPLTQRCGEAVPWRVDFDAALEEAKTLGRPIFWYVATTPDSPADRKDVLDAYMRAGMFSQPDVVSLLAERTVPLRLNAPGRRRRRMDAPESRDARSIFEKYGVLPGKFVEPGFVLVKPDGTACFSLDRLATFHEDWLCAVLDRALKNAGFPLPADLGPTPLAAAARALALGDPERALSELANPPSPAANDAVRVRFLRARALARLGRLDEAEKALGERGRDPDLAFAAGKIALLREDEAAAAERFGEAVGGTYGDEARYRLGAALIRLGRRADALAVWNALAAEKPESPFAWKAAAETEGFGPFVRGFEECGALPPDALKATPTGSRRERTEADAPWLARRGVEYLLRMQAPDGGFEDSNYDFGGRESLPDVYVAVTAIAGRALVVWRDVDRVRCDAAAQRAFAYVADERRCSAANVQERMWAHAYRVFFCVELLRAGVGDEAAVRAKLGEVTGLLQGMQTERGAWFHEYPNPFVTALALQALHAAKGAGVRIDPAVFARGAEALASTRGDSGDYSYGFPGKGDANPVFAAGRNPQAEHALKLAGVSDDSRVAEALERALTHHAAYEAARQYDDHAPPHGIGGFFYFYDEMHRADAAAGLADPALRRSFLARQREHLLAIAEIDGRFVDSHELGKPYGSAAGLLVLKATTPAGP
jgi:hypothetical protein